MMDLYSMLHDLSGMIKQIDLFYFWNNYGLSEKKAFSNICVGIFQQISESLNC